VEKAIRFLSPGGLISPSDMFLDRSTDIDRSRRFGLSGGS